MTETLRGTRPGDALADLVFNFLFLQVLKQAEGELASAGLLVDVAWSGQPTLWPTSWGSVLPLSFLVWADDLALPLQVDYADELVGRARTCAAVTLDSLSSRGMTANTAKGKSECMLAPRGKGAVAVRSNLFAGRCPAVHVLTELGPSYSFGLVSAYKHLGGLITADGGMLAELKARRGKALAAFKRNRKAVYCNPLVQLGRRITLLRASVLSISWFGAGAWRWLNDSEFSTFTATLPSFLRPVYKAGSGLAFSPTNEEVFSACGFPSCQVVLHVARLRHLRTLLVSGPQVLWAAIQQDVTALQDFREACLWIWCALGPNALPHPLHEWDQFAKLVVESPSTWKRLLKEASAASTCELSRTAALQMAARHTFHVASRLRCELVMSSPPSASFGAACVRCKLVFPDANAWSLHAVRKHGYCAQWSSAAKGNTCRGCFRRFASKGRFARHLRYSFPCLIHNWANSSGVSEDGPHLQAPPQAWEAWGQALPQGIREPLHLDFLVRLFDGPGDEEPVEWLTGCVNEFLGPLPLLRHTFEFWMQQYDPLWINDGLAAKFRDLLEDEAYSGEVARSTAHWSQVVCIPCPLHGHSWAAGRETVCIGSGDTFRRFAEAYGTLKLSWDDLQDIELLESLALLANEIVCFLFLDRIAAEPSALKLAFQVSLQCRHAGINCFLCCKRSLACASYLSEPPFSWLQWLPVQAGGQCSGSMA